MARLSATKILRGEHILFSVCEGDDMLVACSRKEKDVVVDCLLWLLQSQWRVQISSCHSHTSSSSRNNTTTAHASSTRSCYNVKRNKSEQCCNSFLLHISFSFVREGELVVSCVFAYTPFKLLRWHITKCKTTILYQPSINDEILRHEGVWEYPSWISLWWWLSICHLEGNFYFLIPQKVFGDLFQRSHFFTSSFLLQLM